MDATTTQYKKILFVDEPFMEGDSIRSKRSRFLWELLSANFDADLLLLKTSAYLEKPVPVHSGHDRLYSLSMAEANQLFPDCYHILADGQAKRLAHILDSKRYEMVVFAGLNCLPLLYVGRKALPRCKYIIDIERNYLPEAEARWKANKNLEALNHLWAYTRQRFWDKFLLKPGSYCFFASPSDALAMQATFRLKPENTYIFPLPMAEAETPVEAALPRYLQDQRYILFWGSEPNKANLDAATLLVSELYPRISKKLAEKDIGIVLYGAEQLKSLCGGRIQYAEPGENPQASLAALLANCVFALLPLTAPDTEGRILQCAAANKALVCTNAGISGWQLPENSIKSHDIAEELAPHIIRWMQYPREVEASANNLQLFCQENYQRQALIDNILSTLNTWTGENDK